MANPFRSPQWRNLKNLYFIAIRRDRPGETIAKWLLIVKRIFQPCPQQFPSIVSPDGS
jgi:hypothetical protein